MDKKPAEVIGHQIDQESDGVSVTLKDDAGTQSRWHMQGDQLEKHLRGVDGRDHPFKSVPPGDLSAARDIANEARKQIES